MNSIKYLLFFLLGTSFSFAQNCPDNINNSPGNSPNTIQADVYDGNGDLVETITCESTGNSNQIDCDLVSYGYPSDYFILIEISNGPNSSTCVYGTDGELLPNNPLPVNLVEFKGVIDENNHILTWRTASETNNDYFTVQVSSELNMWRTIATVNGAGSDSHQNSYTIKNDRIFPGIAYYKLIQTDYDGVQSELSILSIETSGTDIRKVGNEIYVKSTKNIESINCFSTTGACVGNFIVDAKEFKGLVSNLDATSFLYVYIEFTDGSFLREKVI